MFKYLSILFLAIGMMSCSSKKGQQEDKGFKALYQSPKDFDQWITYGTEKWFVENGDLVCESGPDKSLDHVLKMGEWNTMKIRAEGDLVTTWLNGTQMIQIDDEIIGAASGQIALQIHDGGGIKVRWRNIMIKEL